MSLDYVAAHLAYTTGQLMHPTTDILTKISNQTKDEIV